MQRLKDYFLGLGVTPVEVNERTLTLPIELSTGILQGIISLSPDQNIVVFYAASPVRVPEERRLAVAEYITRVNYEVSIGALEMDFNDGEVRYRVGLDYEDTPLSPIQIKNLVQPAIHLMDRYLPGLLKVALDAQEPADALRKANLPN